MHVLWLFFAWPNGGIWGNVFAMPACGIVAAVAAYLLRDKIGGALKGWWNRHLGHHAELAEIREKLRVHADLLDPSTPGGMAAIMAELRETRTAAESAHGAIQALSTIAKPTPRRGATPMQKKATGKADGT